MQDQRPNYCRWMGGKNSEQIKINDFTDFNELIHWFQWAAPWCHYRGLVQPRARLSSPVLYSLSLLWAPLHVFLMNGMNIDGAIIMIQCFFMTKYPFSVSREARVPLILIEITASVSWNGSEDTFIIETSEQSLQKVVLSTLSLPATQYDFRSITNKREKERKKTNTPKKMWFISLWASSLFQFHIIWWLMLIIH